MKRLQIEERKTEWQEEFRNMGFTFFDLEGYWKEGVYYSLTKAEKDEIELATNQIHQALKMMMPRLVSSKDTLNYLGVPENFHAYIKRDWERNRNNDLYGRFDFVVNDGIKVLEYNADTPTSIIESAKAQVRWASGHGRFLGQKPWADMHGALQHKFIDIRKNLPGTFYFTCMRDSEEDLQTTKYLESLAKDKGFQTSFLYIDELGYDEDSEIFVDPMGNRVAKLFKLYPWEYMLRDEFALLLLNDNVANGITFFNPMWRMLLSNKRIFTILWDKYPNLRQWVPQTMDEPVAAFGGKYVKKPAFSREGANVDIIEGENTEVHAGAFAEFPSVYQELVPLPKYLDEEGDEVYAIVGSWVVNDEACGLGVRESYSRVTDNTSNFVPHLVEL